MAARGAHATLGSGSADSTRERLRAIIAQKSLRRGKFILASGRESDFLFDMKKTMLDPEGISLLADEVLKKAASLDADYIGGIAMGAVPIVVAAVLKSEHANRPLKGFWVRKEKKDHGTGNSVDGYIVDGSKVIIVDDVTTTGDSVMKAVDEAKARNCTVAAVITVVDRSEGARENLAERGIDLISVFTKADFGL